MRRKNDSVKECASRTLEGWKGNAIELKLSPRDLGLIDKVLTVIPELRIVAFIGQQARRCKLRYPVSSPKQLREAIGSETFRLGGHLIDKHGISAAMAKEWFPLHHEGEFLSAVHLALARCRTEALMNAISRPRE